MSMKLYSVLGSPAVRGTLLTIRALGLKDKIETVPMNLLKLEQLKPQFIEKNPLHTVPLLEDGDFTLWDSHAINSYLVGKYSNDDSLYPKDLQKRALVDSMAHFDTGYIFARSVWFIRAIFEQDKTANFPKFKTDLLEVFDMLELILQKRTFVAGDHMTIADLSIAATFSTAELFVSWDPKKYPKIDVWYQKMKALPYYSINQKGVDLLKEVCKGLGFKF